MRNRKIAEVLGLCALMVTALSGCKEKPLEAPESYAIGADSAPSLDTLLTEETGGKLVSIEMLDQEGNPLEDPEKDKKDKKEKADKKAKDKDEQTDEKAEDTESDQADEEAVVAAEPSQYVYAYEKLTSGGTVAKVYAEALTSEDNGFEITDDAGKPSDAPDYAAEEGTVILAEKSSESGYLFRVRGDWTEKELNITVDRIQGAEEVSQPDPLTMNEVSTFLLKFKPSALGLSGDSMSAYNMYPSDGMVFVDDIPCVRIQVYSALQSGTNVAQATYFMPADQSRLFRLDEENNTVTEIAVR